MTQTVPQTLASAGRSSIFDPPVPEDPRQTSYWGRLHGAALGLALVNAARHGRTLCVVTGDARGAQRIESQVRFFGTTQDTLTFPDWECLPYDNFSPHQDIISQRLRTLHRLPNMRGGIVIVAIANLMQRLPPRSYVDGSSFDLAVGDRVDIESLRRRLQTAAYQSVGQVLAPGEYSVRGGLIDIFPMGSERPFRLDLFDDELESIRFFDPESQRSTEQTDCLQLLPARELPLDEDGVRRFRQNFRGVFEGDPHKSSIYRDLSNGLTPAGIEFYLPLFFEHTANLFDYLPDDSVIVFSDGAVDSADGIYAEIRDRFELAAAAKDNPVLPPPRLYLPPAEVFQRCKEFARIQVLPFASAEQGTPFDSQPAPEFKVNPRADSPYGAFLSFVHDHSGRILLVAETTGRREVFQGILREHGVAATVYQSWDAFLEGDAPIGISVAELEYGLYSREHGIAVITETQLYGERVYQRRRRRAADRDPEAVIRSLAELKSGDPIVHEDHGVGRYLGLTILEVDGGENEFLTIEYQDGDKLYIPVLSLHQVSRYVGPHPDAAPLHKLGSDAWLRAKQKAREKAYDVAAELLEVHALRMARTGHAFPRPDDGYNAFAASFPFEETPDQSQVIDDVLEDMASDRPMDRLICGDVGFGKTEIAMRAAFLAVNGGRQVGILVPTTLLAQQHFDTLTDRLAEFPIKTGLLSRFQTTAQIGQTLARLADGTMDIVVGTHRLLQRDIKFKNLGLLIIDEEHRFGVRQKERLKQLRSQVDILTLTATPIPRTLNMALSGMRDISIVATPPRARLSIKTFVREWHNALIKEACLREVRRGGQVYFLHNEVRTIEKHRQQLAELLPEADIRVAHGQMPERELERIMRDFYHQRFSILVCTTIIESGIDVPTANTIIINRADRFGLAQLHQLRGRVGRSHHQAYAYLLTPPRKTLSGDAVKRLQAIESLEDLGAGFALASHDLEIRGAGELLGEAQSGMIDEVGFTMYSDFLNRAIAALKTDATPSPAPAPVTEMPEIDLHLPALFPETFLPDVHQRLVMYKRIANAANKDQLRDIQAEAVDRFGLLPDAAATLFKLSEYRIDLVPLGLERVDIGASGGRLKFRETTAVDPSRIIGLIESDPTAYRMHGPDTLILKREMVDADSRFQALAEIIGRLG